MKLPKDGSLYSDLLYAFAHDILNKYAQQYKQHSRLKKLFVMHPDQLNVLVNELLNLDSQSEIPRFLRRNKHIIKAIQTILYAALAGGAYLILEVLL